MGQVFKRGKRYGIAFTGVNGKRVRMMVASDKSVAQKILGDQIAAVEKLRAGVLHADPREARRPITGHLDHYISDLERRGRAGMYIYNVRKHIEAAAAQQGWSTLIEVTPREVGAFLRHLSTQKRSAKTINDYRADLSAFLAWCVKGGILESNACLQVPKTTVKADKKRRALAIAECRALLAAAPPERRVVYLFLVFTGLRRSEAAAIKWAHVHLEVANPFVELPASITKSGRRESVPLVPELAGALRLHRAGAKDAHPVFESIPSMPEFRRDLATAGIDEEDARGRKVVLHSLRHTLATMLAASQVPIAVAQRIMRHRDIRLTAEVYTDESLLPCTAAMAGLPALTSFTGGEHGATGSQHSLGLAGQDCAKSVPLMRHNAAESGTAAESGRVAKAS